MIRTQSLKILVLLLFLPGCRNNQVSEGRIKKTAETNTFDHVQKMKEVYYRFPSPDEMLHFINKEELIFNSQVLHSEKFAANYLDSKSQALNLGIYIADLAYITLFQRQKEALVCFQVVYGLSDKLRISSAFDSRLMKRFENNMHNADSLRVLTDEALTCITDYLAENDKDKVFAIISIGGFVESLFLAFSMIDRYEEGNMVLQRISDQKLVMQNLVSFSLEYSEDLNVTESLRVLNPILSIYNELSKSSEETKVTKTEDGKLIISGGDKIVITENQYLKLREATFAARKEIINNLDN